MRRAWAVQTSLAVLLAFVAAPFLHVHMAEKHRHDRGPVHEHEAIIHAHLPDADAAQAESPRHDAELSRASHSARPLEVFAIVPHAVPVFALPFLVAARIELVPATVSIELPVLQSAPRTHDPPFLDPTRPRAPPA